MRFVGYFSGGDTTVESRRGFLRFVLDKNS